MTTEVDALTQARSVIENRLKELDSERKRLETALKSLNGNLRGSGRAQGSKSRTRSSSSRQRRRRRGGTRAEHALKAVQEKPGITAAEIAAKLKIKPNYVYRVMSNLTDDGKVKKEGRGYKVA